MEDKLQKLLEELHINVFVRSTDSISGEVTQLDPQVQDREATIYLNGEWDREDLKKILSKVFPSNTPETN